MIAPTKADIGRRVLYVPRVGPHEAGVITSFSELFVFVRYGANSHSAATLHDDLEWEHVEFDPLDRLDAKAEGR